MRFSNDVRTWSAWETFKTTKSWPLANGGDGMKTVYMELRDAAGNVARVSDTILLDTYVPPQRIPVTGVSLDETTMNLKQDESITMHASHASIQPEYASNKQVSWSRATPM